MDFEERENISAKHAKDPQPGDYWDERGIAICVVIRVIEGVVILCKTKKRTDDYDWTWDLKKLEGMSVEKFDKWLSYDTIPGYWAWVYPGEDKWAADHVNQMQRTI